MDSTSLQDFISHAREARRIRFGDLRRLQRDILPARLTTREDAELLIALDAAVQRTDPDWSDYLVGTVRDFVVWGLPPYGAVDRDKAEWLVDALSSSGGTKTARTIAREVVREAREVDEALLALFSGKVKPRWRNNGSAAGDAAPEAVEPGAALPAAARPELACPTIPIEIVAVLGAEHELLRSNP